MTTDSTKSRFLDPAEIERGLDELARITGGTVALAGGVALQLYGSDRFTRDLDVVGGTPIAALPDLGTLSFGGYKSVTPSGVPTDVIIRDDAFAMLYADALVNARLINGSPLPVVTREHLIAMKMVAGRTKDDADLEFLILHSGADLIIARGLIDRLLGPYAAKEFDQLIAITRWRATRGEA